MPVNWSPAETARRVYSMVARATIKKINDKPKLQEFDIEILKNEEKTGVEYFGHYGFKAVPKKPSGQKQKDKAEALVMFLQGDRSHAVVLAVDDRRYRPKDWEEGESGLYDDQKQLVRVRRGGIHVFGGETHLPIEQQVKDVHSIVKKDQVITTAEEKDENGNSLGKSIFDMLKDKMTSTVDKSVLTLEKTKTTMKVDGSKVVVQNGQVDIDSPQTNVNGNQTVTQNLNVQQTLTAVAGAFGSLGGNSPLPISEAVLNDGTVINDGLTVNGDPVFTVAPKLAGYTVAALNTAYPPASNEGRIAYVTDASAPTWRGTLSGGGAVKCMAFCDGANWTAA